MPVSNYRAVLEYTDGEQIHTLSHQVSNESGDSWASGGIQTAYFLNFMHDLAEIIAVLALPGTIFTGARLVKKGVGTAIAGRFSAAVNGSYIPVGFTAETVATYKKQASPTIGFPFRTYLAGNTKASILVPRLHVGHNDFMVPKTKKVMAEMFDVGSPQRTALGNAQIQLADYVGLFDAIQRQGLFMGYFVTQYNSYSQRRYGV